MKKIILITLGVVFSVPLIYSKPTAYELIKKMDQKQRGNTSFSRMSITVLKPGFKRTILLDSWDDKKKDKFFLRILKPKKDSGVTFLKGGENLLWQYIPKIGKEIKIESSLMGDSWMGSDFTNDDLLKQSSIVFDYKHTFAKPEKKDTYKIVLNPKRGVPTVWHKIIIHLSKSHGLPVQQEFYDHKNRLKKLMVLSHFKNMGGRLIAQKMVMASIKKNRVKSKTVMIYKKVRFNLRIPNMTFSKANLRR